MGLIAEKGRQHHRTCRAIRRLLPSSDYYIDAALSSWCQPSKLWVEFNKCLAQELVPLQWKQEKVVCSQSSSPNHPGNCLSGNGVYGLFEMIGCRDQTYITQFVNQLEMGETLMALMFLLNPGCVHITLQKISGPLCPGTLW